MAMTHERNKTAPSREMSDEELAAVTGGGSFDIEQVLNIGSASAGSGAGKVTFNPFVIDRKGG